MQGSRKSLLLIAALALAGAVTLPATPAQARVGVSIYATLPPPPLRVETVPAPRVGYVWVPGDWRWGHRRYNWHRGHWMRGRHGYRYAPSRWEREGDRNRWRYHSGRWEH